ncbi:MAG: monofunctional biosynthetic peptidoglycan transglycosylase [Candidatus Binatota bacterium]
MLKSLLVSLFVGLAAYEYSGLPDVSLLRRKNPATTALIELRNKEYREKRLKPERQQIWVSYDALSENLKKAIILSEDASFFSHKGVDLFELKEAVKEDWEKGKFKRGGSTITMQLAKNLYLSPSKSPLRKLREIVIALQLEQALSKRRIFEIYLNVIEWGNGIYGAEAAARHYFSKPASDLDPEEAATLAALLPSPRNPGQEGLLYRRNLILTRMASTGFISAEELDQAKTRPLFYR